MARGTSRGVLAQPLYICIQCAYRDTHTSARAREQRQLRKLSRDAECLRAVRKLLGSTRGWRRRRKRTDRRLKCRFRATLEPRKHLNAPFLPPGLAPLSRLHRLLHLFFLLPRPFTLFPCHPYFTFAGFPHPRPLTSVVSHLFPALVSFVRLLPWSCHSSCLSACPALRFTQCLDSL